MRILHVWEAIRRTWKLKMSNLSNVWQSNKTVQIVLPACDTDLYDRVSKGERIPVIRCHHWQYGVNVYVVKSADTAAVGKKWPIHRCYFQDTVVYRSSLWELLQTWCWPQLSFGWLAYFLQAHRPWELWRVLNHMIFMFSERSRFNHFHKKNVFAACILQSQHLQSFWCTACVNHFLVKGYTYRIQNSTRAKHWMTSLIALPWLWGKCTVRQFSLA